MVQEVVSKGKVQPWPEFPTHSGEVEEGSFIAWPTTHARPQQSVPVGPGPSNLSEPEVLKDALHPDQFVSPGTIMSRDRKLRIKKKVGYQRKSGPNRDDSWWELTLVRVFANSHRLSSTWSKVFKSLIHSQEKFEQIQSWWERTTSHKSRWECIRVWGQKKKNDSLNCCQLSSSFATGFTVTLRNYDENVNENSNLKTTYSFWIFEKTLLINS